MPNIIRGDVEISNISEEGISFTVTLGGPNTQPTNEGYNYAHGAHETAEALHAALLENVMLDHAESGDRVYLTVGDAVIAQGVKS